MLEYGLWNLLFKRNINMRDKEKNQKGEKTLCSSNFFKFPFRENLCTKEGQTDSTPVDKYRFTWTWTTKGVRCYFKFQLWTVEGLFKL